MTDAKSDGLTVLAIHRYYWPDTPPYASLLREVVTRWTERGHRVDVLSTQPSYKPVAKLARRPRTENVAGARVRRVNLPSDRRGRLQKAANAVLFPLAVFQRMLLGRRYDVVMCSTAPPVLLGAAVSLAACLRRTRFIYHCMDLHPEIGRLSGDFSNPWFFRLLLELDRWTCRGAAAIVVLSEDMRRVLVGRDQRLASRIHVINNFELSDFIPRTDSPTAATVDPDRLTVVFTGNIGRFQGLRELVEAVSSDSQLAGLELVLMGDGTAKQELQTIAERSPCYGGLVRFIDHSAPSEARDLMRAADLGLVSLTPGVIRYAFPSKTATYLCESLPVIAVVEDDSDLARLVINEGIGFVAPPQDPDALRATLREVLDARESLPPMRVRAARVAREQFGRDVTLDRWDELLGELVGPTEVRP